METLELPTGERVTPDDVFLFDGYPYRFVPREEGFVLSPLHWGGGDMDLPFGGPEELSFRWDDGETAEPAPPYEGSVEDYPDGTMADAEWAAWLDAARDDDRFGEAELDAVARELGVADGGDGGSMLARVRGWLRR